MKLLWAYLKVEVLELIRYPAYVVPTLAFPALIFLFFGVQQASGNQPMANRTMAAYGVFAVVGVAFFQFGVGIATDRATPWQSYLRALPASAQVRFAARVLAAVVFAAMAIAIVFAVSIFTTPAALSFKRWLLLGVTLLLGSVPLGLMGIALGYWCQRKAALPIANLLYLSLSYAGGLWLPPERLPKVVAGVSPYLPTRLYMEVAWRAIQGTSWPLWQWAGLVAYSIVAGALAVWGYRRDEGERYR